MQIRLSKIKSSPQAIRTTWSEEKMDELAQSIKQHGLLQAIKIRPVGEDYEIVYGHRRAEASRKAGHTHIEAVVDWLNDPTALIQGLVENVQREDLGSLDMARALKALKDATGWSNKEMGRQGIMSPWYIGQLLALLEEPEEVQNLITQSGVIGDYPLSPITEFHVREVRQEKLSPEDHVKILKKAAKEGLTASQARVEARNLKTYGTEEEQVARAERQAQIDSKDTEQRWWDENAGEVAKDIARTIKRTSAEYKALWLGVERGAIGPEHMPYLEKRLRSLGEYFVGLADELDERRKGAVGG